MRTALAVLMALHGTAHLAGFVTAWRLVPSQAASYKTTVLAGRVDLGASGIHVFGVLWLLAAAAFWLASIGAFTNRPWWVSMALGTAIVSLALSLIALPESRIGVPINLLIVVALLAWQGSGTL